MSRVWMPLFIPDYMADTGHLSTTEHGAYLLLIMHYWTKGGLPRDEETIRRITRLTPRQWSHSCDVLRSLFLPEWRHKRIDSELAKAIEKSRVNSANAKRSHSQEGDFAERSDTHIHIQSSSLRKEEDSCAVVDAKPACKKSSEAFAEFWKAYPRREGANPRAPAEKLFLAAVKSGTDPKEIIEGAKRCTQRESKNIGTPYIPQAVKWLRDKRWLDYNSDMLAPVIDIRAHLS